MIGIRSLLVGVVSLGIYAVSLNLAVSAQTPLLDGRKVVLNLSNGDKVSGLLVAIATDHLDLENSYSGRISIKLAEVRNWQAENLTLRSQLAQVFTFPDADTIAARQLEEKEKDRVVDVRQVAQPGEKSSGDKASPAPVRSQGLNSDAWKRQLNFGYTLSRGNVSSSDANAAISLSRGRGARKFSFNAFGRYGVNNGSESAALFTSLVRFDETVARLPVFSESQFEIDKVKKLDYRISQNFGLSYPILKKDTSILSMDFGTGVTKEAYETGLEKLTATNLFRVSASQKVNQRTLLTQQATLFTNLSDPGAYRLRAEASLTTPISKHLAVKLSGLNRYDARPQGLAKPNDFTLLTGFTVDF